VKAEPASAPAPDTTQNGADNAAPSWQAPQAGGQDTHMDQSGYNAGGDQSYDNAPMEEDNYGPINVKEDG
jgi:RNA-binding protein Musashi